VQGIEKGIFVSIWIWIIIKISEKVSGNTKYQIQNRFLYWFIWIWHSYGKISILGLLCGIGVQITNIIIVVLYLFFDISRELLGACWVTSLIPSNAAISSAVCDVFNVFFKFLLVAYCTHQSRLYFPNSPALFKFPAIPLISFVFKFKRCKSFA
jgi:hypothetical protein